MSTVNETAYLQAASTYQSTGKTEKNGNSKNTASKTSEGIGKSEATERKQSVKGAGTYGDPKLSETGLKYYNELKKKYGNLNFVLVASDKKQEAEMMKGSFANSSRLTVLIDTDKIEQMATDSAFREKYESILSNATSGMNQMKAQLGSNAGNVKAYGMTFDKGGTASFFAVIDKSLAAQKKRIEKKAEDKKTQKKEDAQKAAKKEEQERLEEARAGKSDGQMKADAKDDVTITASSMGELMQKLSDYFQDEKMNYIQTPEEKTVGQRFDWTV